MKLIIVVTLMLLFHHAAWAATFFDLSCHTIHGVLLPAGGEAEPVLLLNPQGAKALLAFSEARLGRDIAVTLYGEPLLRMHLLNPLRTGRIPLDAAALETVLSLVRARCPAVLRAAVPESRRFVRPLSQADLKSQAATPRSPAFPVTCAEVTAITLAKLPDALWREDSTEGVLYRVGIHLDDAARQRFAAFRASAEPTWVVWDDVAMPVRRVELVVQGQRLLSDAPLLDGFASDAVLLIVRTLSSALALARTACPDKVPSELLRLDLHGREIGREAIAPGPSPGEDAP
ncbi:hypothetical protein [Megalodesulfovibrio gigas]|nr:hypothetical protein [Megalodesulfovibrio gigas]